MHRRGYYVTCTDLHSVQCAGNRRKEMSTIKPVVGVLWDDGVIANCKWGGARLRDVLAAAGLPEALLQRGSEIETTAGPSGLFVRFNSSVTPTENDTYYGASISLEKALSNDALLAYEVGCTTATRYWVCLQS